MDITTIPRNRTKKIAAIREQYTRVHAYSLKNGFTAAPVNPDVAWRYIDGSTQVRGKLRKITNDDGTELHTIQVHDNLWYELRQP